jgi:hypothetical protein
MTGLPQVRADVSRATDCVGWAWTALDPLLVDGVTDPAACLPFVEPETRTFYWELHFQQQRLTRIDFLHRPALVRTERAGASTARDPIVDRLTSWYAASETARKYCDPSVWLELDGPIGAARDGREQGISICVDPRLGRPDAPEVPAATSTELGEIFTGLERACDATKTRAGRVAEIQRAVAEAGGTLRHVSIMRGRPGQPVKIYAAIPKATHPSFLDAIDWPGDRAAATRLAENVCAESQRVNIDLLIDEALAPRIGYEIFSDPSPAADPRRTAATERAIALGLITRGMAEALRRWPGKGRRLFGNDQWPTTVQRWLDLKFVSLGANELELKSYLGFRLCRGIFR